MAYKMVFDTETTSINKPFCYDIGYLIFDTEDYSVVKRQHYVVEQAWHNLPLFESAYYAAKRPLYVSLMKAKKATMDKFGYITQAMIRDIKTYEITDAYAYNSDFDTQVFNFNCDWYKVANPFDTVAIHDIWGYACEFIFDDDYKAFCEKNSFFTEKGNYSGNAETAYRFITDDLTFEEKHMGLYDSDIEANILFYAIINGAELDKDYPVTKMLTRLVKKPYTLKVNGKIIHQGEYLKKYVRNDTYSFTE